MKMLFIFIIAGIISVPFSFGQQLDSIRYFGNDSIFYNHSYHYDVSGRVEAVLMKSYLNGLLNQTGKWEYAYNGDKLASRTTSAFDTIAAKFDTTLIQYYYYDSLGREKENKWYFVSFPDFFRIAHREIRTYTAEGNLDTLLTLYFYNSNDTVQWSDGDREIYHYAQSKIIAIEYASAYFPPVFTDHQVDSIFYDGNKINQVRKYSVQNDTMSSSFYSQEEYHYNNLCPDRLSHLEEVLAQGQIRLVDSFYYYRSDCLLDSLGYVLRGVGGSGAFYDTFYQVYYYSDTSTAIGPQTTVVNAQLRLYPNPASAYIMLSGYIPENETGARVEFYDMQGRLVKTEPLKNGLINQGISTKQFAQGVYAYRVYSNAANIATGRIFIEP